MIIIIILVKSGMGDSTNFFMEWEWLKTGNEGIIHSQFWFRIYSTKHQIWNQSFLILIPDF